MLAMEEAAYTPTEVCELLGVSRTTLWRDEAAGRITPHYLGGVSSHGRKRYSESEVARYREGREADPPEK